MEADHTMRVSKKVWILLLAAIGCPLAIPTVQATPITWNLSGVAFDDGGSATGSFVFDADTDNFSAISVTTSGGTTGQSHVYISATQFASAQFPDLFEGSSIIPGTTANLSMALVTPMTNAGGTINIQGPGSAGITQEGICILGDSFCTTATPFRQIVSGSITTRNQSVPEPAGLTLMALGLAGIGYRCKQNKAA